MMKFMHGSNVTKCTKIRDVCAHEQAKNNMLQQSFQSRGIKEDSFSIADPTARG